MTNIRRAIATFSLVAILSTFVVSTAVADTFKDVLPGDGEVYTAVEALVVNGSIAAGDTFGQATPLTRGEAAKFLVVSAGYTLSVTPCEFTDVLATNVYAKYIQTAKERGIVGGKTATTFAPGDPVTRAEFAKMAVLAFELPLITPTVGTFGDVPNTGVAYPFTYVETAVENGIINGMTPTVFAPASLITKSQGAMMAYRATEVEATPEEDTTVGFDEDGDTEGSVKSITEATADESEALEGQTEVEVYALDIELDDNGPLQLQRADIYFEQTSGDADASTKPWDFFTEVSIAVDGEVVDTLETDSSADWGDKMDGPDADTTEDEYRLRFSGLAEALASDEITKLTMLVSVKSGLDSADEEADWTVELAEVRVMDETGFVSTEEPASAVDVDFGMNHKDVASFAYAIADEEVAAQVIEVSKTADTNGVEIFAFDIEEENGVDANITELTMTLNVVTDTNNADVVKTVYLLQDGEVVGEESVSNTTDLLTFSNLDIDIAGDTTETFTVEVDLEDTNESAATDRYVEGETISIEMTAITEVTDANDNDEDEITGLSIGLDSQTHQLRSEGVKFEYVSSVASVEKTDSASDQGEFTITFKATAFGADEKFKSADMISAITSPTDASYADDFDVTSTSTDTEDTTTLYELDKGVTRTFTLTVIITPTNATDTGFYKVNVTSFDWGETTGTENTYNFDMGDYKTGSKYLTGYSA